VSPRRFFRWTAAALAVALVAAAAVAWFTSTNDCDRGLPAGGERMRAVVHCEYGSPDLLELREVPRCVPGEDELLVRVRAAAVNPLDWHYVRGTPYVARLLEMGLRKPKVIRLGVDFAGTVEAVGAKVTRFRPGDDVFGGRTGSFAEYVCVREHRAVVHKPPNVTFEQAAAVPVAAVTALQGLRDEGALRPGQKVLVNGASGGVGTFAVQLAKASGAEVTGVCSTRNVELVRSLGADRVVDYTREDFAAGAERYDVLLDNVGNRALSDCRRVLAPEGRYVMVGGPKGRWLDPFPRAIAVHVTSWFVPQRMGMFLAQLNPEDLTALGDLLASGKVTPVIDRRYPLAEVPAAIRYVEEGRARGKVVITVE
jgi:NADPH:quinone reductase-like Zn-dependent oxidoreductase